jgi:hypothetical protein
LAAYGEPGDVFFYEIDQQVEVVVLQERLHVSARVKAKMRLCTASGSPWRSV